MIGFRLVIRSQREGAVRPRTGQRTLVFGAGDAGDQLIRSMLGDPDSPYLPVGLLDDDPTKRHARIRGVRMLGGRDRIAAAAAATVAEVLVIALPSAGSALVRDISQRATAAGPVGEGAAPRSPTCSTGGSGIRDVRDIDVADLLGRRQIDTNVDEIADYLRGKRVLVTGAGGSIGSELCRQIAGFGPAELMMLDRDESALHALQLTHLRRGAAATCRRRSSPTSGTARRCERLFLERRPEVVFHAAALKHVNMLEQYPDEGWKTNVLGTRNVLAAATVGRASPTSSTSRPTRRPTRSTCWAAPSAWPSGSPPPTRSGSAGRFLSVRFGNVLGSRGSVLETFAAQIARGGPVTVTHPDVTRYFMTIPEAVQLVIQAGAIGSGGEALVLDMGDAGADRRRRGAADQPWTGAADRHPVHRPAPGREAARGPVRCRRAGPAARSTR